LLADRGAEAAADKSPQFQSGCVANFPINHGARSQPQRATVQLSIEKSVDLGYWQNRIVMINGKFIPSRPRRCVCDKANLIAGQICHLQREYFGISANHSMSSSCVVQGSVTSSISAESAPVCAKHYLWKADDS